MARSNERKVARGVGASPGVATGRIVFRSDVAVDLAAQGTSVILLRIETSSEDAPAVRAAAGTVTTRGGLTGDAAIIARCLGKPCIVGCDALRIDYANQTVTVALENGELLTLGVEHSLTIDGSTGELFTQG